MTKNNFKNWHGPVFSLFSSFHFPSSFLSDRSDPFKNISTLFNCQLQVLLYKISCRLGRAVRFVVVLKPQAPRFDPGWLTIRLYDDTRITLAVGASMNTNVQKQLD